MNSGRVSIWVALLAALALLAAACGSSGESDDATDTSDDTAESTDETTADTTADEAEETTDDTADAGDAEAAGEPIKIGALTSLTGPFASWGLHVEAGMKMAADDINAAGGVDGRMIEIISADDQSDAEEAVVQYERLLEEGVVAVAGTISSGVGAATAGLAEEAQVPLFFSKSGSDALLTQSSRYTFRTCLPAGPMNAIPWGQYAQDQGFTKVGQIIADYAWGQSFKTAAEGVFGEAGIELKTEVAPVPETDFTTYLRSLDEFGPELILATGHPPGSGPILAQAADLGIDVNVAGPGSSLTAVMEAAGDTAVGRYADHSCADYFSDDYAELATRYVADTGLGFMEDDAVAMYAVVNLLAEAVASVGDDPVAIAEYLHGASYDSPGMAYPLEWTEWGELAQSQLVLVTVTAGPAPEGLNDAGDWWVEELFTSDPIPPYEPAS
ncbi:MAG: ABC transporter substrate-binding protein [Acidimicrobiia bacterium]|nr:ABC transporter substrate-binding protein [Acidimicrobiia bacterium]